MVLARVHQPRVDVPAVLLSEDSEFGSISSFPRLGSQLAIALESYLIMEERHRAEETLKGHDARSSILCVAP